jgi:DNA-3-methyladenine glycosylase II
MATLIRLYPPPDIGPIPPESYFDKLASSIIGQQLSVKAANTIESRLRVALGELTPKTVTRAEPESLRGAGLSAQKSSYLVHLAEAFSSGGVVPDELTDLPDQDVVTQLTAIRGVGPWTAEMFLIFGLGRLDVWSPGDLGLRKGVEHFFGDTEHSSQIAARWAPYRSIAAWYIWEHSDRGYPALEV